jgi:uncharacterized protein YndB with AHSA1/START domain
MTNSTSGDSDCGELERSGDRLQLRFTRRLPHPPEKVWRALTAPQHLAAWFPTDIEGERATGAPLRFVFRQGEGPTIEGEMQVYEPPSVMQMRWGEEILRFELQPDGDGSVLSFTNIFDELGKAARDAAGWHVCLDALAHELNGQSASWPAQDRWREVHAAYKALFGSEASTIGPPEEWERIHGSADQHSS